MTFQKISVLVPTRKRLPQLATLLASFDQTTTDGAELVFRVDDDDRESLDFLESTPWTVVVGPRFQGYRSLPLFFNEMRQVATGDVLMAGNDDMVFRTPLWHDFVLKVANQYPDGIFDLAVETHNAKVVPFSIVSKHAIDMLGYFHDSRIYWGDVYLRDVMAAFGRVIPVPVQVDHAWMGATPDRTFQEANQGDPGNWDNGYWRVHRTCVAEAVAILKKKQQQLVSG